MLNLNIELFVFVECLDECVVIMYIDNMKPKSKSKSGKGSSRHTILMLKQLQLTPHYIYMVKEEEMPQMPEASYVLEMEKQGQKLAETDKLMYIEPTQLTKYPALQFVDVRFIFNVKGLFKDDSTVKIKMKLEMNNNQKYIQLEEFQIHLLEYSYEHSRERFVTHKENSTGRLRKYIMHYSFSAIYERHKDQPQDYLKHEIGIQEEQESSNTNGSAFGISIKEAIRQPPACNTIVTVEAVTDFAMGALGVPGGPNMQTKSESQISFMYGVPSSIKEMVEQRNAPRSFLFRDDPLRTSSISNITEPQIAEELKLQSSMFGTWVLIVISAYLIYLLMHPNLKI